MGEQQQGRGFINADDLFAAVARAGITAPVFLDGQRVSIPESDVMRLAAVVKGATRLDAAFAALGEARGPVSDSALHREAEAALVELHLALSGSKS